MAERGQIANGSSGCRKQLNVTFVGTQIGGYFAELYESGFEIFDDFLASTLS
jgi:hypothetical protein